jgi:hypothetical protein
MMRKGIVSTAIVFLFEGAAMAGSPARYNEPRLLLVFPNIPLATSPARSVRPCAVVEPTRRSSPSPA